MLSVIREAAGRYEDGVKGLANALRYPRQALYKLKSIPPRRAREWAPLLGKTVEELCPDVFGPIKETTNGKAPKRKTANAKKDRPSQTGKGKGQRSLRRA